MNGISTPAEPVYRTCYAYNSSTRKMEYRTYNYTEMLEKMKTSAPPEGVTYWEPDEHGRVYIDPRHPMHAAIESTQPPDYDHVRLPDPGKAALPGVNTRTEEKQRAQKKEERKEENEQIRLLREDRLKKARQDAMLHRLAQTMLFAERF